MKGKVMFRLFLLSLCLFVSPVHAQEHDWQVPLLGPHEYRTAFMESEKELAAFMLCNTPERLSCEDAEEEMVHRFASDFCQETYFVALVNGRGSGHSVLYQTFKVVFAVKTKSVWPILVSFPDEDTSPVNCWLISQFN